MQAFRVYVELVQRVKEVKCAILLTEVKATGGRAKGEYLCVVQYEGAVIQVREAFRPRANSVAVSHNVLSWGMIRVTMNIHRMQLLAHGRVNTGR